MEPRTTLRQRIEERKDWTFDLVRIYLGIGLFVKGLQFLDDREFLVQVLRESGPAGFDFSAAFLAHYIPLVHIGGGILLALGLATRIAALLQIPVLIGAVFFVYGKDGLFAHNQELQFTALVLFLLLLVFVHGAGPLSLDRRLGDRGGR